MPHSVPHLLTEPFHFLSDLMRIHARQQPQVPALFDDAGHSLTWQELDVLTDRIAASLQRSGLQSGAVIAICALNSVRYAAVFLGALRAGMTVAPLAPSSTADSLAAMLRDADARLLFADAACPDTVYAPRRIALADDTAFAQWLAPEGSTPTAVTVQANSPFNIIYSSGTTGTPKGIVQSHGMRWGHIRRAALHNYGPGCVTLLATPLYSNTTLVTFFPTLGAGGCVVLMAKFDALRYLQLAEQYRASHTMLVPVQYQRIMALPEFGRFDLSAFQHKFCTSAPFRAELKADVVARWPGTLTEFYGMTEGGGTCVLEAHLHPNKLHTVGRPVEGHDIRLIDEAGHEVAAGGAGEVVGHSPAMMTSYHNQPEKTREAEWFDASGKRFIRTGDVGRFDADGFLTLIDRRKDMIISGGFNIYPSDLESQLRQHPSVADVAVTGVASAQWGETPVAFVVPHADSQSSAEELKNWYNQRAGKTQRLADLRFVSELPRSAIGKVLKRDLRENYRPL